MSLKIYNTLTRKKEDFETLEPGRVRMYVCGPTVYANAHVGHAMSALVFDILRRYLEYRGYEVRHVMNFTDVDDKIIARANQSGEDPFQLAERYIQQYERNLADLNVLPATVNPRATREIEHIQKIIQELIAKGYAYPTADGDVYFRVRKDEDYGKLSRRSFDDVRGGTRVEVDEAKEDPLDFALWKSAKPGEPSWDSPWGKGRPGWHIECSAMSLHHLGEQIDIHGGGNDLIFPHHENEIAQSESLTGKPFVRYWVHNGMLQLGGEKMSKSLGNSVLVSEMVKRWRPIVLRYYLGTPHYRSMIEYSEEALREAESAFARIEGFVQRVVEKAGPVEPAAEVPPAFAEAMDDDLGVPQALAIVHTTVRQGNSALTADDKESAVARLAEVRAMLGVLGLDPLDEHWSGGGTDRGEDLHGVVDSLVRLVLEQRQAARARKDYATADAIRDQLQQSGLAIEDTPSGPRWSLS